MIPIIFVMPIIQLIILVNAMTFEMKNIRLYVEDMDLSPTSRQLITKFGGSPFFKIVNHSFSERDGEEYMKDGKTDAIIRIPIRFEKIFINTAMQKFC